MPDENAWEFELPEETVTETPAAAAPVATEPVTPAAPAIDPVIQQKLDDMARWQQGVVNAVTGQTQQPQHDPNAFVNKLVQEGDGYIDQRAAQLIDQRLGQYQAQVAIDMEFSQKYADLLPAKNYIMQDARQIAMDAANLGQSMTDSAAIAKAAQQFKANFQTLQQNTRNEALKATALNFNVGSEPKISGQTTLGDVNKLDDKAFQAVWQQMKNTGYTPK